MRLPGKLLSRAETAASGVQARSGERLPQKRLLPVSGSERLRGPAMESKARKDSEVGAEEEGCWPGLSCGGVGPEGGAPHQGVTQAVERPRSNCT